MIEILLFVNIILSLTILKKMNNKRWNVIIDDKSVIIEDKSTAKTKRVWLLSSKKTFVSTKPTLWQLFFEWMDSKTWVIKRNLRPKIYK